MISIFRFLRIFAFAATACGTAMVLPTPGLAASGTSARVTRVIEDVKLLPERAAARPAVENDSITRGTAVRTGTESRAELTFTDATITRLGSNTIFSFNQDSHEVELGGGAILIQVPPNGGETKATTASVTAAITGGTAMLEFHKDAATKFLVLEGTGKFYRNDRPNEIKILHGGEMIVMTPNGHVARPVGFNARQLYLTSKLIADFAPLPNKPLILRVIARQEAKLPRGHSQSNDTFDAVDQRSATQGPANGGSAGGGRGREAVQRIDGRP